MAHIEILGSRFTLLKCVMNRLLRFLKGRSLASGMEARQPSAETSDTSENSRFAPPETYPNYPPPPPEYIIANRDEYRATAIRPRRFAAPRGEFEDNPLYALYRLYEWFLLDHVTGYRNDLEIFWRKPNWRIEDIPDPVDDCPSRYAFLAGVTHLLVASFNKKISYGASRSAPAIMTNEYMDALKAVPDSERAWEKMPRWADATAPLPSTLVIPTHDNEVLDGMDDPRADAYFKSKNILLWTPHIHFT